VGDRTTVSIEVLESARPSVEDAFGQRAEDAREGDLPGTVVLTFFEVNGGGFDLLTGLAKSGIVFRGSHGEGIEHYGMTFAAHDGTFAETPRRMASSWSPSTRRPAKQARATSPTPDAGARSTTRSSPSSPAAGTEAAGASAASHRARRKTG
jgi:hypothetical protein